MTPTTDRVRRAMLMSGLSLTLGTGSSARAQPSSGTFPSGVVRLIVPFPPGSGADVTARTFSLVLGRMTGKPVVVENKAGANGLIAVQAVLQAPPDGHTILLGSNSTLSTNAALLRKLPYDPLRDLTPITVIGRAPALVIVPPNSPYKTLADLIADGRNRAGALNYGSGSPSYTLYSEWLAELAGFKATNVPYKGAGDAVIAIAGGQIDFAVVDGSGATPLVKSGKVRGLVLAGTKRSTAIPDVPTALEAGLPEFLAFNWTAAAVSARTPAPVAAQIEELFMKVGQSAEVREQFVRTDSQLLMMPGGEMRRFQQQEIERWKRLAEQAKLQLD